MTKLLDLSGQVFGRLTVQNREPNRGRRTMWRCLCICGNDIVTDREGLMRGSVRSCGCYRREVTIKRIATMAYTNKRLYNVYDNIKARCYRVNSTSYRNYGARGIKICDEWLGKDGFKNFCLWALSQGYDSEAPRGKCTIDRIDVNKGYSPGNCRFVDAKTQGRNTRANHMVTINNETHCVAEWAEITGVSVATIYARIKLKVPEQFLLYKGRLSQRRKENGNRNNTSAKNSSSKST